MRAFKVESRISIFIAFPQLIVAAAVRKSSYNHSAILRLYRLQPRVISSITSPRSIETKKTGVHQASVSQRAQEIPHRPIRDASQRYRQPGSPDRVAQRTDWPIDGA